MIGVSDVLKAECGLTRDSARVLIAQQRFDIAEKQWANFDQVIDEVRTGQAIGVAPKMEALEAYEAARNKDAMRTVFASGCRSWYLNAEGVPQVWPWSYAHFVEVMAAPIIDDYRTL